MRLEERRGITELVETTDLFCLVLKGEEKNTTPNKHGASRRAILHVSCVAKVQAALVGSLVRPGKKRETRLSQTTQYRRHS